MPPPDTALRHYARQQRLTAAALIAARRTWAQLNPDALDRSWRTVGPRLLVLTSSTQRAAVIDARDYVPRVLEELEIDSPPAGRTTVSPFVGVASDGRPLGSLLHEPIITTKSLIGAGSTSGDALSGGLSALERIIATQLADAARGAVGVGIASRQRLGYVRMLTAPSCSRCAVLAGKFFRFNRGFQRHPRCDCRHIPCTENISGDLTTDPRKAIESGQVTGLSQVDMKAITEGADVAQVVNAKRGVTTAGTTTEGTTRRGFAGRRLKGAPRLTPDAIYRQAATREEAIDLLRTNGYLI